MNKITFNSPFVCTSDNVLEEGQCYDYSESGCVARVEVLSLSEKDGYCTAKVKTKAQSAFGAEGRQFDVVFTTTDSGCFSGMMRFWDKGEYILD